MSAPLLFSDRGCPFARRVLALAEHLGCSLDRREARVGDKPAGLDRYSASRQIPLLVDGDLVLTESRAMLEHLAERHGFAGAWPADLDARSLHRQAMSIVDARLAPLLRCGETADAAALDGALDALEAAIAAAPLSVCLLALHVTPVCQAFRSWHPAGGVTRAIESRTALCAWLDAADALDCLAKTRPDPITHAEDILRARRSGLLLGS